MHVSHEVVEPFAENAWLIGCRETGAAALIDPGGRVPELVQRAQDEQLRVEQILLTHAHLDHVIGVADAVAATGASIALHPDDRPLYEAVVEQGRMFGLQVDRPPDPDRWLRVGEVVEIGALRAEVLFVPGHSPGHVAFWFAAEQLVVSGDVLFAGSIGRTDLPGGSYSQLMASIRDVLEPLGDEVRVLPGHGPETTIGRERATNPFLTELRVD